MFAQLENRGVLAVSGPDAPDFLQALISQDVGKADGTRAVYGALLTPQGKYLHDFFLLRQTDQFLFDCEAARRADFAARLKRYRLRSKVEIDDLSVSHRAIAFFGDPLPRLLGLPTRPGATAAYAGGVVYVDPRATALGYRAILPASADAASITDPPQQEATFAAYDAHRIGHGAADGSRDLEVEKSTLLEASFDELNGIDWAKGCYVGQELTARTKYRGLLKKRLLPVRLLGATATPGTPVTADGRAVGALRSVSGEMALALLRLDAFAEGAPPLKAGDAEVEVRKPDWLRLD